MESVLCTDYRLTHWEIRTKRMLSSIFAVWNYLMFGSMLCMTELESRIAEALAMQKQSRGNSGESFENSRVLAYLKQHGSILSSNPLLAQVNPKYPTDAVWSGLAVRFRDKLAEAGYVIVASGRKPTKYTLVTLPSVAKQAKPAPAAQTSNTQVTAKP